MKDIEQLQLVIVPVTARRCPVENSIRQSVQQGPRIGPGTCGSTVNNAATAQYEQEERELRWSTVKIVRRGSRRRLTAFDRIRRSDWKRGHGVRGGRGTVTESSDQSPQSFFRADRGQARSQRHSKCVSASLCLCVLALSIAASKFTGVSPPGP